MNASNIESDTDILSLALKNLLTPLLDDDKFVKRIKKLKKRVIVVELKDLYSLSLSFDNGAISINYGEVKRYKIKMIVTLNAFMNIAKGQGMIGLIGTFLKGEIKIKKIYRIFTILKFYKVFFPAIKMATKEHALEGVINIL